ncbi:hypothetical protein GUJ93_ZPchr0003g17055 [Zizania palustris]|uniref:Uncharacterized protein n=1 Tax=Zizania palustris TaxID=103762 RepID=A0A8J5S6I2_ZIZPA|nr:hypothetical protein GUJ93_ZPchr0003g17055 [Zizania palustris]
MECLEKVEAHAGSGPWSLDLRLGCWICASVAGSTLQPPDLCLSHRIHASTARSAQLPCQDHMPPSGPCPTQLFCVGLGL